MKKYIFSVVLGDGYKGVGIVSESWEAAHAEMEARYPGGRYALLGVEGNGPFSLKEG